MKVLIAGDYCEKNRVSEYISKGDFATMFDEVIPIINKTDISIVNFEFPILASKGKPIKKCGPTLKGQPKAVEAIKYAGFNVCTLANNHILDQGEECCIYTKHLLEEAGIQTVGVGNNLQDASKVLYIEHDGETLAIINCCENEFSIAKNEAPGSYPLNPIKQYYQIIEARKRASYVLVVVHGGHEHFQLPSPRMKEIYHFFISIGADAVVNHHQHCYSGYEVLEGKPIIYGLGNLLFDWNSTKRTPWNEGYMVILDTANGAFEMIPYIQSLESPCVKLMDGEDTRSFYQKIDKLNKIIADDKDLEENINNYYDKSSAYELSVLEPYKGKILGSLFYRGFLPRLLRGDKLLQILNHTTCESHLDKLHYALRKAANDNK